LIEKRLLFAQENEELIAATRQLIDESLSLIRNRITWPNDIVSGSMDSSPSDRTPNISVSSRQTKSYEVDDR
jgi:hypothetical protein